MYEGESLPAGLNRKDLPALAVSAVENLEAQLQQEFGFVALPENVLIGMAAAGVTSVFEFGQYLSNVGMKDPAMATQKGVLDLHPGLAYGLGDDQYHQTVRSYDETYRELTGEASPDDLVHQALQSGPGYTSGEWRQKLLTDKGMQEHYGWLKYGITFDQFTQQKDSLRSSVGHVLSNEEALTQIADQHQQHSATGRSAVLKGAATAPTGDIQATSATR